MNSNTTELLFELIEQETMKQLLLHEKNFTLGGAAEGTKKISIFPGAFKPFHRGHYKVVQLAAAQSSQLYLCVSTKDRIRPGEFPLTGEASMTMWKKYVEPILPENVKVVYTETPINAAFDILIKLDKKAKNTKVYLIAGAKDINRYRPESLEAQAPNLSAQNMIEIVDTPRFERISGTDTRAALSSQDKKQFKDMLPPPLARHSDALFKLFYNSGMKQIKQLAAGAKKKKK